MLDSLKTVLLLALVAPGCTGSAEPPPDDTASTPTTPTTPTMPTTPTTVGCVASTPVLLADGTPSGWESCADGTLHRIAVVAPGWSRGTVDTCPVYFGNTCTSDAECTEQPMGGCVLHPSGSGSEWCGCEYGCGSDADCGAGQICLAVEVADLYRPFASCVSAECASDADCPSSECALSLVDYGCDAKASMHCRAETDVCRSDADCVGTSGGLCLYFNGAWVCETGGDCGRPLLVDGERRLAPVQRRADWSLPTVVTALDEDLAAHWVGIARLEHASVASFARVTLQLLALGAPADLVGDTQVAAADEVLHARLAFGLASAYAGRTVGPGPMTLDGGFPALDPAGVLCALVDEACVGEVLGAAEASASAASCTDPAVADVLRRIAQDETRHAALAWRTLRWLVQRWPELRPLAHQRLEARLAQRDPVAELHRPEAGVLGGTDLARLRNDVRERVIRPLLDRV